MRRFLIFLLLYLLFLLQTGIWPLSPDFTLLTLIVVSLYEDKITSTLFGVLIGLCFDLTAPTGLGINMLSLSITGYAVSTLRNLFYQGLWQPLIFTFLGLLIKYIILILTGSKPNLSTSALTIPLTLFLSLFLEPVRTKIFKSKSKR